MTTSQRPAQGGLRAAHRADGSGEGISETVGEMREEVIEEIVAKHIPENAYAEQWDVAGLKEGQSPNASTSTCRSKTGPRKKASPKTTSASASRKPPTPLYREVAERFGDEVMNYVERSVVLQTLDALWREHIVNLDHLRSVVGFRGYAQRDPLQEYKGKRSSCSRQCSTISARPLPRS
jgi:preprotein translocase subunit SecA